MASCADRIILHSDMNSFYASVEQAENPQLHGKPVVVAGKEELRHGIVLTKSVETKKWGIKTAETLWSARQKCPDLIVLSPRYKLYRRYSELARSIYYQYTDLVEPFGLDECWLDITGSVALHGGDPLLVANEISERVKAELGCTVSIGLSWNKIFAKFGSDLKKPDAITRITRFNYRDLVWKAPCAICFTWGLLPSASCTVPASTPSASSRTSRTLGWRDGWARWVSFCARSHGGRTPRR